MATMYKKLTLGPGFGAGRGGQLFWRREYKNFWRRCGDDCYIHGQSSWGHEVRVWSRLESVGFIVDGTLLHNYGGKQGRIWFRIFAV